ncbi:hypothetical protein PRIPAC_78237 [Pristionchus pacificus]|uniref:Uncharacterized protein n=1 Tax=Pristionchus pacificus TaxID=54126 RepID=A0A2A6BY28_PRIPA|nr:hypothetical protein PRIPAC_78237 [Pristionchus pacificus]|eukprot:PDM70788.1 hypothetical protein PRIPAC_44992 [Pristionchus pacificus]
MHSSAAAALILALASVTSALEFSDRVVERSPTHETVALAPVDLASLPAWDQAAFEKSHPDLVRSTNAPRSAGDDSFAPGQVLFGNGGFFNSFGSNSMMMQPAQMGAPLFMVQQPLQFPSAFVSSDDSGFKWSSVQTEGDREISVIQ